MHDEPVATLPPLYDRWLGELLDGPIPPETEATCEDCAMCAGPDHEAPLSGYHFDPTIKCCTYVPEIPNFLVGRILAADPGGSDPGVRSVRERIVDGASATPLGIGRSAASRILYDNISSLEGFGRSGSVRCPHYLHEEGGRCGIWENRTGVCATWFCKHGRGAVGKTFWNGLQRLLGRIEVDLARWCLLELELDGAALQQIFQPSAPSNGPSNGSSNGPSSDRPGSESNVGVDPWGGWADRKEEFYRACGELVGPLGWDDVIRICGAEARLLARLVRDQHRRLVESDVPEVLGTGSFQVLRLDAGQVRICSYSLLDPLDVPRPLFDVLHRFDGERPWREVLEELAYESNIPMDDSLVRTLVDFRILEPRGGSA